MEQLIQVYNESLVQELALKDELDFEKVSYEHYRIVLRIIQIHFRLLNNCMLLITVFDFFPGDQEHIYIAIAQHTE
jgi:hypothetical protein